MADVRQDPVSGRWVIIATERAARPRDFHVGRGRRRGGFCPFCQGNEDRTPPEIAAIRSPGSEPNGPGWQVRVVENKFPALSPLADSSPHSDGLYQSVGGYGAHEVFIESPRHVVSPAEMTPAELGLVIEMWCERSRTFSRHERVSYVLIFKNVGAQAGASIEHAHSQLIALPVMPRRVAEEIQHCLRWEREQGSCLLCDIVGQERQEGVRVVADRSGFIVLAPYAARFPFELWVLPAEHRWHFHDLSEEEAAALADVLWETVTRLEVCLREPPMNLAIHTAPVNGEPGLHYHWHIEVIPRVTHVAGFEWGTGFYINTMAPEKAAEHLRAVSDDELERRLAAAADAAGAQ